MLARQERQKERQVQICRAAEELFGKNGYHRTSIRSIAARAGVSIGSIYECINNKEDLLYLMAQEFYEFLKAEVIKVLNEQHDACRKLEGTIETMLRVVDGFRDYTLFTYRESQYLKEEDLISVLEQEAFFTDTLAEIILQGMNEGVFRPQEPQISATLITMLIHSWALKAYKLREYSLYYFQRSLVELVLSGVLVHDQGKGEP
jgi:AcrR family transcriptional regulator